MTDADMIECPCCRGTASQRTPCALCYFEVTGRPTVLPELAAAYRLTAEHTFDLAAVLRAREAFHGW